MDIAGKTCIITGANSGLGLAASKQFARLGCKLILVCRDRTKGENAVQEVLREIPQASIELLLCDFASIASTQKLIEKIKGSYSKIDVLFNNAAVWKMQRCVTGDSLETMFQVNYLAPFMLTTSLLDLLKNGSPARIINIAVPPRKMHIDFDDLQVSKNFKAFYSFFHSKLCLLLFSLEISKRLSGTGINLFITDPGPGKFKSDLTREAPRFLAWMADLFAKSADKAAETIVYLASSEDLRGKSGSLFLGKKIKPLADYWEDNSTRERLWAVTETLIESHINLKEVKN
jgi:NAD(P)-dependent dehydrogenase (short-subunit alcohol dehydrogenase family)